jgi:hypothetical protein
LIDSDKDDDDEDGSGSDSTSWNQWENGNPLTAIISTYIAK